MLHEITELSRNRIGSALDIPLLNGLSRFNFTNRVSRSDSRGRISVDRSDVKRRRLSPVSSVHSRSSPKRTDFSLLRGAAPNCLLNVKQLIVPDILARFPAISSPVDLYRIMCHWQDSFTLLKPFYPERSTVFQILGKVDDSTPAVTRPKAETGFYVNVLLLSMPSIPTLQDKTTVRAESSDREKVPLRKYIKILALSKTNERFKAIGGPWNPDLDGQDPVGDSRALINAAIRICKEQLGLDLSYCTQWHRFLEFRYSRTEGSTARPASVLFPGSQLWGRSFPESANSKSATPSKPYHRIVVYFLPDIWSLMPSTGDWANVKRSMENALSRKLPQLFPMSQAEINALSDATSTGASSDDAKNKSNPTTCPTGVTATALGDTATTSTAGDSQNNPTAAPKPDQSDSMLDTSAREIGDEGLQSPTRASGGDKNDSSQEVSELREQLKVRNLPADGIKAQLLSRLKTAVEKEAEQARKEEEERKKKEKEMQEALAAKEEEDKKRESSKPTIEISATPKADACIALRNYPSIIVQKRLTDDYTLQTVSLDSVLESKSDFMDARSYELVICVHNLFDMVRRDFIFTLFRALVTAGDRGIQAKSRVKGANETVPDDKVDRNDPKDHASSLKEVVKLETVDLPLLCACTFLDSPGKGYFYTDEVEDMIVLLGLPVSRYQVRSLVTKVADGRRIYYRSLTDSEVSPSTIKAAGALSEIDDDEYLFELIRGGDAILDEQKELAMPTGSVMVLRVPNSSDATEAANETGVLASEVVIAQQIAQLEADRSKLKRQLRCKTDEIDRLRSLTDQIPTLKEKLASANKSADDLRHRLRGEYERMHSAYRVIEQQVNNLDTSRTALRQAANRLRGREDESTTPAKKAATEQKDGKREQVERKGSVVKSETTTPVKTEQDTRESKQPDDAPMNLATEQMTEEESKPDQTMADVSESVAPLCSPKMINGLEDNVKVGELLELSSDTRSSAPIVISE
ncbi:cell division cycle and apoptosis regulator protein 1 [Clonorchis sinensis]|uniref:Cell division cycle and apoptosis regulator protein 1 n=1 Tax=Clonorchis sinensis TaxID=79923 RepID=G7Y7G9_CLOSI|nr:cell division cycle and apoptosis regulator protein 1 [Clonorchis sinensis]